MASNAMTKSTKKSCAIKAPKLDMRDAVACQITFEKCENGCRIICRCDDAARCDDLQCLCDAISGCNCSCCCVRGENQICIFNMCSDDCTIENTDEGCCITCTSADAVCCEMLQASCDCLNCCCENGCCCYIYFGEKCCCFGGCNS